MDFLIYEQDGPVVTLTMNQPEKRNPLSGNTSLREFLAAVNRIHDDRSVRCVIITGNGPSFSSGGNIQIIKDKASPAVSEMDIRQEYRRDIQRVTRTLYDLEVPVVVAVNGHAIGAGLGLACMGDVRIASDKAKFGAGFIKVGIIPGDGSTWLMSRIIGPSRTAELMLTGDIIDAQTAKEWNLVSQVVPHEMLMEAARGLAGRIAQNPSHTVRLTKRLLREAMRAPLETVLELSAVFQAVSHKMPDQTEAVDAFLEKRAPQFSS